MLLLQDPTAAGVDPLVAIAAGVLVVVAALAWLVLRLSTRIDRLEQRLAALEPLSELPVAVGAAVDEIQRRDVHEGLRAQMADLAEAQVRLAGVVDELSGRVERHGKLVRDLAASARERPATEAPALPEPEDVSVIVARHLADRGFEAVRLLTESTRLEGRSGTVAFEARRDGVMHKGHVVVEDGRVRRESVRAAYSAFP